LELTWRTLCASSRVIDCFSLPLAPPFPCPLAARSALAIEVLCKGENLGEEEEAVEENARLADCSLVACRSGLAVRNDILVK